MGIYIDNDGIKFLEEFKVLCAKYVKSATIFQIEFKDNTTIGMRTLLEYSLGHRKLEDCL